MGMVDLVDRQNEVMLSIDDKFDSRRPPNFLDLERRGFSRRVQELLEPFETGKEKLLVNQLEACERVRNVLRSEPETATILAKALGFDRLVKKGHFKTDEGEERILGRFGQLVRAPNGGQYPVVLETVLCIVANGLPRDKAEVVLDEISRSRATENTPDFPKGETMLQWAFRVLSEDYVDGVPNLPDWAKEKLNSTI